ncbi:MULTISPECIES: LPXTG cell wall anchor domain-containing protein [Thomasclavelia]|nr:MULTISPECIES: LPXTG cell wall anchor domain-containing protein [Thomasclavelia]MBU9077366.1 LPXTG cell wall anchor domain-containing protein [Erysipelatoclostridium sp. MSK.7.34]MCI7396055.1 LPXTG cell wall anchor domain-containing protein [Thomasclavelia ramosa]MCR1958040.1 LPXTG cell wall anchor domain-containing protein [Thomasclavelia ramosa]MDC2832693.1 LPXTG cell wall anchor domain-containing protein [Thomasclavelia ramosa]QQV05178.1 LPXTG cell wall anchor domain-containing protein [T
MTNSGLGIMWGPVSIDENAILIVVLLALLIIGTLIYYKRKK